MKGGSLRVGHASGSTVGGSGVSVTSDMSFCSIESPGTLSGSIVDVAGLEVSSLELAAVSDSFSGSSEINGDDFGVSDRSANKYTADPVKM